MENLEKRIAKIAEGQIAEKDQLFLVDVLVKGNIGNQKVLIFIDSDDGLNIDDCSLVSKKVGTVIEEEDFMPGKYLLEVSSPGLDHPIKLHRQYKKNKGRNLEVEMISGAVVKGKLINLTEDEIVLEDEKNDKRISFKEINQSKIEVSFK